MVFLSYNWSSMSWPLMIFDYFCPCIVFFSYISPGSYLMAHLFSIYVSFGGSLQKEAASFQEKGANLPKEISISHNKSHAKLKEALALQNSNNSLTKELQTTALSKDSSNLSAITKTGSQLMMEEFLHIFQAKDSTTASCTANVPLISVSYLIYSRISVLALLTCVQESFLLIKKNKCLLRW